MFLADHRLPPSGLLGKGIQHRLSAANGDEFVLIH
jgi:hypothetical protein